MGEVAAGAGHNVLISGEDVNIAAEKRAHFEANSIALSTGWNGDVKIDTAGGAVTTGGMQLSGAALEVTDPLQGLQISSQRDIELLPGVGHDVVVAGGGFSVSTTRCERSV